jgi:hypothetical protein
MKRNAIPSPEFVALTTHELICVAGGAGEPDSGSAGAPTLDEVAKGYDLCTKRVAKNEQRGRDFVHFMQDQQQAYDYCKELFPLPAFDHK